MFMYSLFLSKLISNNCTLYFTSFILRNKYNYHIFSTVPQEITKNIKRLVKQLIKNLALKLGKSKRLEIHSLIYDFLTRNLDTVICKIIRTIPDVIQMTLNSTRNV